MKNGWQYKRLGDVCEIIKGRKPVLKRTPLNGDLPYLVAKVMRNSKDAEYASLKDRNSIAVETSETIIICDGSNSGEVFTGFRGILSSTMGKISKKAEIDDNYLRAFLASTFEVFNGAKTGAAIPHLDKNALYDLQFPCPPLPEQKRIVGILDKAFDGIATAKANAEKNLRNARELFESHLQTIFTQRGAGWVKASLGEVYDVRDGTHDSPKYHETGYPLITSKNLKHEGLSFDKVNLINEQDYNKINERSAVHKGDVLFAMIGTIGNPTRVTIEPKFAIKNVALFKVPPGQNGAFLKYYLGSGLVISKMMKDARGTTQKFVGLGYLRGFPINIPPLAIQIKITEKLNELSNETQYLEAIYKKKLAALDELKKSLLRQAFHGQL
jgi:type I restriction enzyme S subunit